MAKRVIASGCSATTSWVVVITIDLDDQQDEDSEIHSDSVV